ncbi:MAG: hypothetical protein H6844_19815 [Alphaproteobacteria bacterium]|nr:hypothetical protein [Alphaproteobacteria bacterium]
MSGRGRDRRTLRNYFDDGALPSGEHFGELIESTVNKVDDGFDKTPADGLKLTWLAAPNFISLYRGDRFGPPVWRVAHDPDADVLQFNSEREGAQTSLAVARGQVGVNTAAPSATLDVAGVVRARGRIGYPAAKGGVAADGEWHPITDWITGCQAFEVMAGVGGGKGSGRYAMLHAVAMNAYNPGRRLFGWFFPGSRRIRTTSAAYGRMRDRILLRWRTAPDDARQFRLELRSRCPFDEGVRVRAHLTQLWHDPAMTGDNPEARPPASDSGNGGTAAGDGPAE